MKKCHNLDAFNYIQKLLALSKDTLTTTEVARLISKSGQFVRDAVKHGHLLAHTFQGRSIGKSQQRKSYLIPMHSLILFLLERATYTTENYRQQIARLIHDCPDAQLEILQEEINHKRLSLDQLKETDSTEPEIIE